MVSEKVDEAPNRGGGTYLQKGRTQGPFFLEGRREGGRDQQREGERKGSPPKRIFQVVMENQLGVGITLTLIRHLRGLISKTT